MENIIALVKKWPVLTISFVYWSVSSILYYNYGIKIVADSPRYLEYAQSLSSGFYIDPHNIWYFSYVGFIFLATFFGSNLTAVVFLQYLLSYAAVILLYKTSLLLFNNLPGAILTALWQILFLEILAWNSYLLPESIYISLVCLSLFLLAKVYRDPTRLNLIFAITALLLTIFSKPTGVALAVALMVVLLIGYKGSKTHKAMAIFIIAITGLILLNRMLKTYPVIENYARGETIYEITFSNVDTQWLVVNSEKIQLPDESLPPLLRIVEFILYQPVHWLKLFATKILLLFIHLKPYWSWQHNLFALALLFPVYFFSGKLLMRGDLDWQIKIFTVSYVVFHALGVGLTWEDWDGRFLLPMLPVLFLLASFQAITSIRQKKDPIIT